MSFLRQAWFERTTILRPMLTIATGNTEPVSNEKPVYTVCLVCKATVPLSAQVPYCPEHGDEWLF